MSITRGVKLDRDQAREEAGYRTNPVNRALATATISDAELYVRKHPCRLHQRADRCWRKA